MPRQDDPTICGAVLLYRRIPPYGGRVTWDETGTPTASSLNFKDAHDELSLHIAQETTPDAILAGTAHDGFGLVCLTAQQIRDTCGPAIIICRDDEDPANGHVLVCGKISNGMAKKLSKLVRWVEGRWPRHLDPNAGLGPS